MSSTVVAEASISPPLSNHIFPVTLVAGNPTTSLQLPIEYEGHWITLQCADGVGGTPVVHYSFSQTAQVCNPAAMLALGPPLAPAVNGCWRIQLGETVHWDLRNFRHDNAHAIFLNLICTGFNAVVRFTKTDGPLAAV